MKTFEIEAKRRIETCEEIDIITSFKVRNFHEIFSELPKKGERYWSDV
jgi:hypothetical protein